MAEQNYKLDILSVFGTSFSYWKSRNKEMWLFSLLNFLSFAVGLFLIGSTSNPAFLVWVVLYYIFWSCFFRYVFDKKPYYQSRALRKSLLPSTKIFLLTIVVMLFIISLPWLLSFLALPFDLSQHLIEYVDGYVEFLERDKAGVELMLSFVFILIAPFVFYRPFYAWIASIVGRKGSVRIAFEKTKGNYWQFLMLGLIMNGTSVAVQGLSKIVIKLLPFGEYTDNAYFLILFAVSSPIIVFYNIYMAKSYETFYPEG
ncbi:MAG: hypothetical protein LBR70_07060 [Lactobacillaceae bacterium]|jgi:hypothetical protein|nr:hypothetical protein [Lactobacillaceae bacterium]